MSPQQTPYQKVNVVDINGDVIQSIGGGGAGDASEATLKQVRDYIGNQPVTSAVMPAGGAGLFGWLSAIWKLLSEGIQATKKARVLYTGELSEPGTTISFDASGVEKTSFFYTVASLDLTVLLQAEISADNITWSPVNQFPDVVHQNGSGSIEIDKPAMFSRLRFVQEYGGANAVISIVVIAY